MKELNIDIILNLLSKIYKTNDLLYIGIGSGEEIDSLKYLDANGVILIDADINQIERINKWIDLPNNFKFENRCIYNDEKVEFNIASYYYMSGVANPRSYKYLMPNIKSENIIEIKSISLDTYIKEKNIEPNYLFIDTLDANEILKYANNTLKTVDVLVCLIEKNKLDNLIKKLKEFDLKLFYLIGENHPEILKTIFVKDYKNILKKFNENLQKKEINLIRLEKENKILKKEIEELEIKNESLKQIYEDKILVQKEELNNKIEKEKEYKQQIEEYKEEMIKLNNKIRLNENNKKLKDEFNETLNQVALTLKKDIHNVIRNESKNIIKQLESYYNISNFLNFNTMPLNFHGWPISSDLGEFLLNKIVINNYDVVLEFGSGTSTLLFAQIIQKLNVKRDVPIKQIAFDHHKKYYQQTKDYLKVLNLEQNVDLNYAPLVSLTYKETEYKYYDCISKFEELKSLNMKNLLALVDGPPGNTCKHARFPAILYLTKLAKEGFDIDVVLDDYYRKEEKNITQMWENFLRENKMDFTSCVFEHEKGTYFLTIKGVNK